MVAAMTSFMRFLAVLAVFLLSSYFSKAQMQDPTTYFGGADNEIYLEWLNENSYDQSQLLPSPAGNSTGAALHWTIKDKQIFLAVAAKATGWVAFGIAESGGMFGADVVIYTASTDSLMDGHILNERNVLPDDCQDWTLVNSTSDGGFLIFEAVRALDTDDTQDRPIVQDGNLALPASRVISAWSDDSSSTLYHGPNNRASTALRFYGTGGSSFETAVAAEAEGFIELTKQNYTIKEQDTEYAYTCFTYNDLIAKGLPNNTALHTIGLEATIDPRASKYVHHFILYGSTDENLDLTNCSEVNAMEMAYGWAPGEQPFLLPSDVGGPLGENGFKVFRLETHYNNPWLDAGVVDSSGVRLYYTSQRREQEFGMLMLGDPSVSLFGQPVGPATHNFDCPSSCSTVALNQSVTVVHEWLHMHQTGMTMSNTQFRDGKVLRTGKVDFYDFEQQGGFAVQQQPYDIQPGDSFRTTCQYMSNEAVFGLSSQQEMCIAFLAYYPRQVRSLLGFDVPYVCGRGLQIPGCDSDYEKISLESDADLNRTFGTSSGQCLLGGTASKTSGATHPWPALALASLVFAIVSLAVKW